MVVTGSPEATRAGVKILELGGNAIDAAVAAALTLGVSDIDASGLGGMTYMLIRLADGTVTAIDGTPRAPMVVDRTALLDLQQAGVVDGYPMAAVPTSLATLQTAVSKYGTMAMADLLQPALEVAETGYRLSPIQVIWTEVYFDRVTANEYFRHLIGADGYSIDAPGTVHYRPDLANTLRRLAEEGVDSFYRGSIAEDIEADMIAHGGFIRKMDLAVTRVREVAPLRSTYRGREVFSFPPPGGGAAVLKTLDILETYPSSFLAEHSVERLQVMIEAARLGRAGNLKSDLEEPEAFLTTEQQKEIARRRAQLITPGRAIPNEVLEPASDPECRPKPGDSTTHLSVADRYGNVVSMTQTIGSSFGAKVATPGLGFPYNNFLLIFNYDKPQCPGFLIPRSEVTTDMAPTIVVEDGTVIAALGSPGSSRIPSLIATVVSNLVDAGMNLGEAMAAPRALYGGTSNPHPSIEILDPITDADADAIAAMGFESLERYYYPPRNRRIIVFGGVNALSYDRNGRSWVGVGDARRWGSAMGPRVIAAPPAPDESGPRSTPAR
jgi:gamma-glutamyltranspeptidase/glutathione hydrolase